MDSFNLDFPDFSTPEIFRSDLSSTILFLLSIGIDNFLTQMELPSPASTDNILAALSELYALQAIDEFGKLTIPFGKRMSELPLSPKLSRFLLISNEVSKSQ